MFSNESFSKTILACLSGVQVDWIYRIINAQKSRDTASLTHLSCATDPFLDLNGFSKATFKGTVSRAKTIEVENLVTVSHQVVFVYDSLLQITIIKMRSPELAVNDD